MRLLPILLLSMNALGAPPALAETPFSMVPEKPAEAPMALPSKQPQPQPSGSVPRISFDMQSAGSSPAAPAQPSPVAQRNPASPLEVRPQRSTTPPEPRRAKEAAPVKAAPSPETAADPLHRSSGRNERPILPFETIRFEGETDARSWALHLTQDEASSGTTLAVGYQNAVMVMPEASRLRVTVNGEIVMDIAIASSSGIQRATAPIRLGLLQAGQNIVRMEALQRHRTDCGPNATYELWTDVDSSSTRLIFAEGVVKGLRSLEDLPAVGVDTAGVTTIRLVAPKIYRPEIRDRLLRLAQLVALRGRYARPVIQVLEADPGPSPVGAIKVVVGLPSELRGLVSTIPDAANLQPLAMMMQEPGSPGATLLVTGPSWHDLDTAIGIVGGTGGLEARRQKGLIDTASWHWPEIPTANGRQSLRFADLGIPTQEFSGRRLKAQFSINLPADFYATEYGEMLLQLDAAYTSAVKSGSHVNIYVNDKISTTITITSQGNVARRQPIRLPMKNFKSGINQIRLETILLTDADERCAPGETLSEESRFVLFDTTTLEIPNFGRIGQEPDLAAMSAGSFPYGNKPATVVLARLDPPHYSAAGTLLARMARSAGEPVRAIFANAAAAGDEPVLFIGALDQLPSGLLSRVNVSENLRVLWPSTPSRIEAVGQQVASAEFSIPARSAPLDRSDSVTTDEVRKRWAETFQRRGVIERAVGALKDWMERTFNLSLASLWLEQDAIMAYEPPQRSTLLMAQSRIEGAGTWTLVTARTVDALPEEMARLADPVVWSQVSGRAAALEPKIAELEVQPIAEHGFVQTQPFSLFNLRLVIANWMSTNILQYALMLLACSAFLGTVTYLLLRRLGRPS